MNIEKFTLKSGNKTSFKEMGSSPAKQANPPKTGYKPHKVGTFNGRDVTFTKRKPGKFVKHRMVEKPLSAKGLAQKKMLKNIATKTGKFAAKRLGPVGAAITATEVITTIPKVVKATKESLKKEAKTELKRGRVKTHGPKY